MSGQKDHSSLQPGIASLTLPFHADPLVGRDARDLFS
jgi:hypothetical protein